MFGVHAAESDLPSRSHTGKTLQRLSFSGVPLGRSVASGVGRWLSALLVQGDGESLLWAGIRLSSL